MLVPRSGECARTRAQVPVELERQKSGLGLSLSRCPTALRYAPFLANIDLNSRTLTAASLSDILRISLLHEFGGVWVDATVYCNRPIDEWLPPVFARGLLRLRSAGVRPNAVELVSGG